MDRSRLVLLPKDPDSSARGLRSALRERFGLDVAVIITDTMGRPWRVGLVDLAIGAAGIDALTDFRGAVDAYGNELHITQMAAIDELASAAELVKGKTEQVPVAVVRGFRPLRVDDGPGAAELVRGAAQDLFALGTAEARALGRHEAATLADAETFGDAPLDPRLVDRALAAVGADFPRYGDGPALRIVAPDDSPWAVAHTGALVHRLRAELAAYGLVTAWRPADGAPLGIVLIGAPPGTG